MEKKFYIAPFIFSITVRGFFVPQIDAGNVCVYTFEHYTETKKREKGYAKRGSGCAQSSQGVVRAHG